MPLPRNLIFAVVPLLALLLVLGVVGEFVLRHQYAVARAALEQKYHGQDLCMVASEERALIYEYRADKKCQTNAGGFHDIEHSLTKEPGWQRIVVIGDSVAEGQGVRLSEGFPRVLEQRIARTGKKVEVITLARTGYSTSQELVLLEKEAYQYQPDLILWTYVLNDPADPVLDNANGAIGWYFYRPGLFVLDWLVTKSRLIMNRLRARNCPQEFHLQLHCVYKEEIRKNFARIGQDQREHRTPIVVVIVPIFQKGFFKGKYWPITIHKQIRQLAHDNGLEVWDVLQAYEPYDADELHQTDSGMSYDPWHPNAKGHKIIGEFLAQKVEARLSSGPSGQ